MQIPLIFPANHPFVTASALPGLLQAHLEHRIPYHKSLLIRSLILLPLTLPVAALPIIPNLPGFYVAFRAYSHWKALQGARFLDNAIREGHVVVQPDQALAGCLVASETPSGDSDGINHSKETAPDATATPAPPARHGMTLPGETIIEKATTVSNLTHGTASSTPVRNTSDGIAHEKDQVSPDTTATPDALIHPSQRAPSTPEKTATHNTSAAILTRATPITTATPSAQPSIAERKLFLPLANVPRLVRAFDFSPSEVVDVTRAVMQARQRWERALKAEAEGKQV